MLKSEVRSQERSKLLDVFAEVEPGKAKLVEGLIDDAAFLYAETAELRQIIEATGMVRVHPDHPELQKPTEAAKQYLKNVNSYSVVIKTLNGILQKNAIEPDDPFDDFLKKMDADD